MAWMTSLTQCVVSTTLNSTSSDIMPPVASESVFFFSSHIICSAFVCGHSVAHECYRANFRLSVYSAQQNRCSKRLSSTGSMVLSEPTRDFNIAYYLSSRPTSCQFYIRFWSAGSDESFLHILFLFAVNGSWNFNDWLVGSRLWKHSLYFEQCTQSYDERNSVAWDNNNILTLLINN